MKDKKSFIWPDNKSLLSRYKNYEWNIGKIFIFSKNFNSYIILLIILIILNGSKFLWFKDLFERSVFIFLLFSIIISLFLNSGVDRRQRLVCFVIKVCDHLNSFLRNSRKFFIFSINLSAIIIFFLDFWTILIFYEIDSFNPFRRR